MKRPLLERFNERVIKTDSCWLWVGNVNKNTHYGMFSGDYAHRISHKLFIGPIPDGYWIDHLCRVRHCVNPEHLEAVTPGENLRRKPLSGTCSQGHNEWRYKTHGKGAAYVSRDCAECHRQRERNRTKIKSGQLGWDEMQTAESVE